MEEIKWLGHGGFRIKGRGRILYIDPVDLENTDTADFIFITHSHADHFSIEDIKKISAEKTNIYATADCMGELQWFPGWAIEVKPGGTYQAGIFTVTAIPAYNLTNERHPRGKGWVGYLIDFGDMRIYHAGDTDLIPEMSGIQKLDYAFLPVSGHGVMTPEDAAEAAGILKPVLSIPMHYEDNGEGESNAVRFQELSPVSVKILKKG